MHHAEQSAARLKTHLLAATDLVRHITDLITISQAYALQVHAELEDVHERLEAIELMHADPAAHGRNHTHHT